MTRKRTWILIASVGIASSAFVAACTAEVDEKPKVEQLQERSHHRGPVTHVIEAARAHGSLTAEQVAAIDAIEARVDIAKEDKAAIKDKLRTAASTVVRSGTADSEQFDEAVDVAMTAVEERIALVSESLAEIHGMLDADQRAAVADALRTRIAERYEARKQRRAHRKGLSKLASRLMLDADQQEKLKAMKKELLSDRKRLRPSREELESLIDAFEGDDFVAAMDTFHAEKLALLRTRVADAGAHADTMLSLLDDKQRKALAELIELGPDEERQ
jgi:hypothetical protein